VTETKRIQQLLANYYLLVDRINEIHICL